MVAESFSGFELRKVEKKRVVRLNWEHWDKKAEHPAKYPAGGEPENYVLGRKHDPTSADALGVLWEVAVSESPGLQIEGGAALDPAKYDGQDICRSSQWGNVFVSVRLKEWLETQVGEWVCLERAAVLGAV